MSAFQTEIIMDKSSAEREAYIPVVYSEHSGSKEIFEGSSVIVTTVKMVVPVALDGVHAGKWYKAYKTKPFEVASRFERNKGYLMKVSNPQEQIPVILIFKMYSGQLIDIDVAAYAGIEKPVYGNEAIIYPSRAIESPYDTPVIRELMEAAAAGNRRGVFNFANEME